MPTLTHTIELTAVRLSRRGDRQSREVSCSLWNLAKAVDEYAPLDTMPPIFLLAGFELLDRALGSPAKLRLVLDELRRVIRPAPQQVPKRAIAALWYRIIAALERQRRLVPPCEQGSWKMSLMVWTQGLQTIRTALQCPLVPIHGPDGPRPGELPKIALGHVCELRRPTPRPTPDRPVVGQARAMRQQTAPPSEFLLRRPAEHTQSLPGLSRSRRPVTPPPLPEDALR